MINRILPHCIALVTYSALFGMLVYVEYCRRILEVEVYGKNKISIRRSGDVKGFWAETKDCTMGLVFEQSTIPKSFDDALPFVVVYTKVDGKDVEKWPYVIHMSGKELVLQLPEEDGQPDVISMSLVRELVKDYHNRNKRSNRKAD